MSLVEVGAMCQCTKCGKVWTNLSGQWEINKRDSGQDYVALVHPCSKGGNCEGNKILFDIKAAFNEAFEDKGAGIYVSCPSCDSRVAVSVSSGDLVESAATTFNPVKCSCGCEFAFDAYLDILNKDVAED